VHQVGYKKDYHHNIKVQLLRLIKIYIFKLKQLAVVTRRLY